MPVPSPRLRQCARYSAAGRRCDVLTSRQDHWCGKCDGFTQAMEPSAQERKKRNQENWERRENVPYQAVQRPHDRAPLEPEDVADMKVSRTAIREFLERHGGDRDAAWRQILSLLEDCMTSGRTYRKPSGYWSFSVRGGSYILTVSPDLTLVTSYRTVHLERTWAQVKAGVKSRVSR